MEPLLLAPYHHHRQSDKKLHPMMSLVPSGKPYRWQFERHGQELAIDVPGPLTLDHPELILEAAAGGLGLAYVSDRSAARFIQHGTLVTVLDEWCPVIPGLFLYYPGRRHLPPGLQAFISILRDSSGSP